MASGSETNDENNESQSQDPFIVVENDPPNVDTRLMMLMEQVAKTNEQIAMFMAKQGKPNTGPQVVIQSRDNDPNTLYEKF